jgi:hypothetical protein
MKTEEDEAFDELAKRQGAWGGGFPAKRKMAADKYSDIVSDGGLDPRNKMDAQPAQEPVACIVKGHLYMAHEFMSEIPEGATLLYTTPPKRPWVGLTENERNDLEDYCEMIIGKAAFEAIEAKLKEKQWNVKH